MASPSNKIAARISDGLKRFQPIVESAKSRDVNESDTVVLLTGILSEILGFDKYTDITTELSIRGTYCDLALKIDGKFCFLLEAKAIGIELKDNHIKQAVDYAANKGIEWVLLSNAVSWKVFKIVFAKPINHILVLELDFLKLNHKNSNDIEALFTLSKEAVAKSSLDEHFTQKQATSRFVIGTIVCSDAVISAIRKELKNLFPDIKVSSEEISKVVIHEVLRREIVEGDESDEAQKKITRASKKREKEKGDRDTTKPSQDSEVATGTNPETATMN